MRRLRRRERVQAPTLVGLTRVISETRPLHHVNEAIADVEAGRVTARIVLQP
jgi:D-arabinose 1-dehydrogenase-like Zn-dependent alcohol dehydrogenase